VGDVLEALRIAAVLAAPAVPGAAAEIWRRIGAPGPLEAARVPDDVVWGDRLAGARVRHGAPLFPRLAAPVLAGVQDG
jgi:methionyl-tRNA synthetase